MKIILFFSIGYFILISNVHAETGSEGDSKKFCSYVEELADTLENDDEGSAYYIDQDLFGADFLIDKNEDRDYTMGLEYSFSGRRVVESPLYKYPTCALESIVKKLSLIPEEDYKYGRRLHSGFIGDTAFTPSDIGQSAPIMGDRPYANLLFLGVSEIWVRDDEFLAITNQLIIGVLGLDIGKAIQTKIHEWTGNTIPRGWDHQISEGGEPTLLIHHDENYLLHPSSDSDWGKPEFSAKWEGNFGYYIDAAGSFVIRWGAIRSPFYTHVSNPLSTANHKGPSSMNENDELYFFIGGGLRLVGYNALLQGQFRHSDLTIPTSDIERLLAEASLGFTNKFDSFKLTFSVNYRSSEFKTGPGDRDHYFGGVYLQFYPE